MVTIEKNGQRKEVAPDKLALFTRQGWTQVDTAPEIDDETTGKAIFHKAKRGNVELTPEEWLAGLKYRQKNFGSKALLPADQFSEGDEISGTVIAFMGGKAGQQSASRVKFPVMVEPETTPGSQYEASVQETLATEIAAQGIGATISLRVVNIGTDESPALLFNVVS